MAAYVVCECCGSKIPAAREDVGKAVVCPVSRRLVMVYAGDLHHIAEEPERKPRKWPVALLALLLLLAFLGTAGYVAWDQFGRSKPTTDTAEAKPEPEKPAPQPEQPKTQPEPQPPVKIEPVTKPENKEEPKVEIKPKKVDPPIKPPPPDPDPVPPPKPKEELITAAEKDVRGLPVYRLLHRLDRRNPDELERELLGFREISLDPPAGTAQKVYDEGSKLRNEKKPYPGPMLAAKGREDLAGLPYRVGAEADMGKARVPEVERSSARLRKLVQDNSPSGSPDPNKFYPALLEGNAAPANDPAWATDAAVPGVQKLLQHESRDVRRLAVEALAKNSSPAATELLCRWAVFDTDPENRAAAVHALVGRSRSAVKGHLLELIRFPWPRAAEHAAEALVALWMKEAIPDLAVLLDLPDPDAPEAAADGTKYRREVVRTNTARNCLLCHAPSPAAEPLRGPDANGRSVTATSTFVRHDFSAGLPVVAGGKSGPQRYDFVVGVYPTNSAAPPPQPSPYREAVLWALRLLAEKDRTFVDWASLRGNAVPPDYRLTRWTGWYRTWYTNPDAVYTYWTSDWGTKFLWLEYDEQALVLDDLRRTYGPQPTYDALMLYLNYYRQNGTPEEQKRADELLAYYRKYDSTTFVDQTRITRVVGNDNRRPQLNRYAVRYVGSTGGAWNPGYGRVLYPGLDNRDRAVRLQTIRYFGNFKGIDEDVYVRLARLTADDDPEVRMAAAETLQRFHKDVPQNTPARVVKPLSEGFVKIGKWNNPKDKAEFEKTMDYLLTDVRQPKTPGYPAVLAAAVGETPTELPAKVLAKHLKDMNPHPPGKADTPKLARLLTKEEYHLEAKGQLLEAKDDGVYALIGILKDRTNPVPLRVAAAELLGRAATGKNGASRGAWNATRDALADAHNDESKEVARAADAARSEVVKDAP
jgi:HEAT repeat protein